MKVSSVKTNRKWSDQLRNVLLKFVEEIVKLDKSGGIAILVWHPTDEWQAGLHKMKWDGTDPTIVRMPRWFRNSLKGTDSVTKRWLKRKNGPIRIFLINGPGTLLINLRRGGGEGVGIYVEPGSTDHELAGELGTEEEPLVILNDERMWGVA